LEFVEIVQRRYLARELIIGQVKGMKESKVSNRSADFPIQILASKVERRYSASVLWVACDTLPLTDMSASVPVTQGFS
jgi:hypothetical protein